MSSFFHLTSFQSTKVVLILEWWCHVTNGLNILMFDTFVFTDMTSMDQRKWLADETKVKSKNPSPNLTKYPSSAKRNLLPKQLHKINTSTVQTLQCKHLTMENWVQNQKRYKLYIKSCTFLSPIYTFRWRKTQMFTRQFNVQKGKSTLFILFTEEKYQLWRERKTFPFISPFMDLVFSMFRQKNVRV